MKPKKLACLLLAAVIALPTVLTACKGTTPDGKATVSSVAIVTDGLQTTYTVGDAFDYAGVDLKVTYSDKSTKTLNLESEGVTHTELDMNTAGKQTLTATYEKKSDSVEITIAEEADESLYIISLDAPQLYDQLQRTDDAAGTQSEDRDMLMKGIAAYEVGADNGFVFTPEAYAYNPVEDDVLPVVGVETVFELYVLNESGEYPAEPELTPETYVVTKEGQNNVYYFTEDAIGQTVKLVIHPSEKYDASLVEDEADITVVAELLIVDGYNVYNQIGLSVFDNLNVKHWAEIKEAAGTLAWDTKPLAEYNDVATVVLHNNIIIDPDELPDYYFWDKDRNVEGEYTYTIDGVEHTEPIGNQGYDMARQLLDIEQDKTVDTATGEPLYQYADKLNGSLRDWSPSKLNRMNFDDPAEGDLAESYAPSSINMQKGLYCSTGTSISGNGMRIGYKPEGEKHKLYSVLDSDGKWKASPLGHWSIFQYQEYTGLALGELGYPLINEGEPVVKNVKIIGEFPRLAKTSGDPTQLMGFNSRSNDFTTENCIISQLYVAFTGDRSGVGRTTTTINDCKFFDFYSNMMYSWRSPFIINNSILKEAGGPVFILVDGDRIGAADDIDGPSITADDKSVIESWAEGQEPWYQSYNATALFGEIKGTLRALAQGYLGREIITVDENGIEIANVIAAIIPDPDSLMKSITDSTQMIQTSGYARRTHADGSVEEFYLNPSFPGVEVMPGVPVDMLLAGVLATQAPFFYSGQLLAAYVAGGLAGYGFPGDIVGTTASGLSNDAAAIGATWGAAATDWIMISTRAAATTPRFGVILGNVSAAR